MKDERPVNKLIRPVLLSMQIIILRGPSGTECFFKKWEPFAFGPSWTGTTMESPMRVIISACVTDIGGNPQRRHSTLGSAFCEEVLNREFRASLQPTGYDHVHIPADFDSTKPVKRWFIFDLDVRAELGADEVAQIPHQVYLASRQGDNWIFIPRPQWIDSAKARANSYTWGGRLEQKLVAGMRNSLPQA